MPWSRNLTVLAGTFFLLIASGRAEQAKYNPLTITTTNGCRQLNRSVTDTSRNRKIPIRIYLPPGKTFAPVVLFSHGLGGSKEGSAFLGRHWSARGYAAVFLQHPGSDSAVWKNKPPAQRMASMQRAANRQNFLLRVKDVSAVLDQLDRWNRSKGNVLSGRFNIDKIGMSGHSFGALTTQAVSGQKTARGKSVFTDPRIDAAVVMSPSTPRRGKPETLFGEVSLPWLLMSGTKDISIIGNADLQSRLAVYPALPAGGKYELIMKDAEHSAFVERAFPGDKQPRNPNHHRLILALSTAFWDAYLRDDAIAKAWLNGTGAELLLQKGDTWKKK